MGGSGLGLVDPATAAGGKELQEGSLATEGGVGRGQDVEKIRKKSEIHFQRKNGNFGFFFGIFEKKAKILLVFACLFFRWGAKDALRGPQLARRFPYQNPWTFDGKIRFFWGFYKFRWVNERHFYHFGAFFHFFQKAPKG